MCSSKNRVKPPRNNMEKRVEVVVDVGWRPYFNHIEDWTQAMRSYGNSNSGDPKSRGESISIKAKEKHTQKYPHLRRAGAPGCRGNVLSVNTCATSTRRSFCSSKIQYGSDSEVSCSCVLKAKIGELKDKRYVSFSRRKSSRSSLHCVRKWFPTSWEHHLRLPS